MKAVILNGSPRTKGSTAVLLHTIEAHLAAKDEVEVEFVDLAMLTLEPCKGCCRCYRTGSCFIDDDAERISRIIAEASMVVIGTPTYASNVSGTLKTFIDRGHFVIEQLLRDTYTVGVVTGENHGASATTKILKSLLQYSGGFVSDMVTWTLPFVTSPTLEAPQLRKLEQYAERLFQNARKKRRHPVQRLKRAIVFQGGIRPFVTKKREAYAGVYDHWEHRINS